jgi:hypothetical protein
LVPGIKVGRTAKEFIKFIIVNDLVLVGVPVFLGKFTFACIITGGKNADRYYQKNESMHAVHMS